MFQVSLRREHNCFEAAREQNVLCTIYFDLKTFPSRDCIIKLGIKCPTIYRNTIEGNPSETSIQQPLIFGKGG